MTRYLDPAEATLTEVTTLPLPALWALHLAGIRTLSDLRDVPDSSLRQFGLSDDQIRGVHFALASLTEPPTKGAA